MDRNIQPVGKQRQYDIGKLGDPYWRDRIPKDYVYFTQETAACRSINLKLPTRLIGSRGLVSANLRNLAAYLDAGGHKVQVWSFFSGEFPYVEMVYQAKQEPEDILELLAIPSLHDLSRERERQLRDAKLRCRTQGFESTNTLQRQVFLIDDMEAFEAEMMARDDYVLGTVELLRELNISFVYSGESKLFGNRDKLVRLLPFDGKRPAYSNRY